MLIKYDTILRYKMFFPCICALFTACILNECIQYAVLYLLFSAESPTLLASHYSTYSETKIFQFLAGLLETFFKKYSDVHHGIFI